MRVSTSQLYQNALGSMQQHQGDLARVQGQIASGQRVEVAADDPVAAARIAQSDHQFRQLAQYQRNLDQARTSMELQDQAFGSMVDRMHRVREIAINAENASLSVQELRGLATELQQINEDLQGLANSKDGSGGYLFGGFSSQRPPFRKDATGAVRYRGDAGERHLQVAAGRDMLVGRSGQDLFAGVATGNGLFRVDSVAANSGSGIIVDGGAPDPLAFQPGRYAIRFTAPDTFDVVDAGSGATLLAAQQFTEGANIAVNGWQVSIKGQPAAGDTFVIESGSQGSVFSLVEGLSDLLGSSGPGSAAQARLSQGVAGSLQDLDQVLDKLEQGRAGLGARLKSLDEQQNVNEASSLSASELMSELRDLDYAEAAARLNQHLLNLQAAQQTFTRLQGLSLFDILR